MASKTEEKRISFFYYVKKIRSQRNPLFLSLAHLTNPLLVCYTYPMEQLSLFIYPVKSCALTGHRLLHDGFDPSSLKRTLEHLIRSGVEVFYNGLAMGFDLLSAHVILELKETYPSVRLIACVPFYGQEKNYPSEDKKRYAEVLSKCDGVVTLAEHYYKGCYFKRNDYLCENADMLLAYQRSKTGGTAYTVKKFRKKGGNILFV